MKKGFSFSEETNGFRVTSQYILRKVPEFLEFREKNKVKYEIIIDFDPFKLTYLINDITVLIFNNENQLNFEVNQDEEEYKSDPTSAVRADIYYPNTKSLFGILERAGDIDLKDTTTEYYRMYNIDLFEYGKDQYYGLYGTWPFVMGSKDKIVSGFLWNNPSETYARVRTINEKQEVQLDQDNVSTQEIFKGRETLFLSESGILDIAFFADLDIKNLYFKYHKLIGKPALPPLFSLGYHQSRWNYVDVKDLTQVDEKFDEHDIPYDTIWLDIEHTNEKRYMTWDSKFDGVGDFITKLEEKGRNLVVIIDPHIKNDEGYHIFAKAKEKSK